MKQRNQMTQMVSQMQRFDSTYLSDFYRNSCHDSYTSMMKHLTNVKVQKQEVHQYSMMGLQEAEEDPLNEEDALTIMKKPSSMMPKMKK